MTERLRSREYNQDESHEGRQLIEQFEGLIAEKSELALAYIERYVEMYGRHEWPSEQERLTNVGKFVNHTAINAHLQKIDKPGTRESLRRLSSPHHRREIDRQRNHLKKEQEDRRQFSEHGKQPEDWILQVAWEETEERMHGGGGTYRRSYDQFGNTYFRGPETGGWDKAMSDLLSPYFNVSKFALIRLPSGNTDHRVRYLAEASETIDSTLITPEDCDRIDPMPITDFARSYVSCMLINLLGGAYDTLVKRYIGDEGKVTSEKNQIIRKDGTWYLYDVHSGFVEDRHRINRQLDTLTEFLTGLSDEERARMEQYVAETVIFIGSLAETEAGKEFFNINRDCKKFPNRFSAMIEASQVSDDIKTRLRATLESTMKNFKTTSDSEVEG